MTRPDAKPLVSVCVPTYNNSKYIGETIQSVLDQSYEHFELLVVDDCSSDETYEILQKFDDERIAISRNDLNMGAARNWNAVIGRAKGQYVKLLCGDDLLYRNCLEEQVNAMSIGGSGVSIVASRRDIIDEDGRVLFSGLGLRGMSDVVKRDKALRCIIRSGTTPLGEPVAVLMRTMALKKTAGFRAHTGSMLDVDMWCQLVALGDLYAQRETLAAFRVQDQSWSHAAARSKAREVRQLWADIRATYPDVVPWSAVREGVIRSEVRTRLKRLLYVGLKWRKALRGPGAR
jgi:glycosyltransferase involved in cell wall biosynthesis